MMPKTPIPAKVMKVRYCKYCGEVLKQLSGEAIKAFINRRYCDESHRLLMGARNKISTDEDATFSRYVGQATNFGRDQADFYSGLVKAINKLSDKAKALKTYKGIKVTPELVKTAHDWLTNNYMGKPGKRAEEAERDDRPESEKRKEVVYIADKLGYYCINKKKVVEEMLSHGYKCEKV